MTVGIHLGNCLDVLKNLKDNSVDSIVTDPPYELGFMGKKWDNTGIANNVEMWSECLRVLKPGGHLLSFSGTRTYHRMACAIEDAGFEVRDMIEWVYSTGFPKSLNVEKQLTKMYGTTQKSEHYLRPMQETNLSQEISTEQAEGEVLQSCLSEQGLSSETQQLSNNERREESSVEGRSDSKTTERKLQKCPICSVSKGISTDGEERRLHNGTQISDGKKSKKISNENRGGSPHRPQSSEQRYFKLDALCEQHIAQEIRRYAGVGTALKPAHEPICMARKPLSEKTVAENCLKWGTGGINIDESRVGTDKIMINGGGGGEGTGWGKKEEINEERTGRFPANLIHDNSEEVRECFPETKSVRSQRGNINLGQFGGLAGEEANNDGYSTERGHNDSGNASRFFKSIAYVPKASKSERTAKGTITNGHPTIKPIALMEYLIKMITPPKGVVLDPFMGSGSTGVAAVENGYNFIGIDMTPEYIEIAKARINAVKPKLL